MSAALSEVVALLEQLLSELAGHHRAAVSIHSVGEVLVGEADSGSLPVLKLTFINIAPLAHDPLMNSTPALMHELACGQVASEKLLIVFGQDPHFGGCSPGVDTSR